MIGKTIDSGFRDWDLLEHELLLQARVNIRQHINELREQQEEITNRHNHMMMIDTTPRYLNTFDIDSLLTPMGVDFDCLIQEQGINKFQPCALCEYKIYSKTKAGKLSYGQKKAMVELCKVSNLPGFALWSHNNNDGSYTWFRLCIHHNRPEMVGKWTVMSDRQYYKWKMKIRNLHEYIDDQHLEALSDTMVRGNERILEEIQNASK